MIVSKWLLLADFALGVIKYCLCPNQWINPILLMQHRNYLGTLLSSILIGNPFFSTVSFVIIISLMEAQVSEVMFCEVAENIKTSMKAKRKLSGTKVWDLGKYKFMIINHHKKQLLFLWQIRSLTIIKCKHIVLILVLFI